MVKLQQQSEYNRENFFIKKEIVKKSAVYFGLEFEKFNEILVRSIERPTTKQSVKVVFFELPISYF